MTKLDKTDKKILYEMDINARIHITQLARKLKISRDIAQYRLKQLEKNSIIRKYRTIIDVSRLGFKMYRIFLKFSSISNQDFKALVNALVENNSVFWVGEADGLFDLTFGVFVSDDNEFYEFYTTLMRKYRKGIKERRVCLVLNYSYLDRAYLLDKNTQHRIEKIIGGKEKVKFDKTDIKILKILSENAREPIIKIAEKLKMDSSAVIYRIKQLEKKEIIIGYKADMDFHIIKRFFYSVKLYLSNFDEISKLVYYLRNKNFLTNFIKAIGGYDVEFDLETESEEQYISFIRELKEKFDFISEINFFRTYKNYKIIDFPATYPRC